MGSACNETVSKPNDGSPMGVEVGGAGGTNWVYVDLLKESR